MTELKKYNFFLIVGLGSIGQKHLKIISSLYKYKIIVVSSGKFVKAKDEVKKNIFLQTSSLDKALLYNPVGAIIASPANKHLLHARQILKKKIPTLIEKPLSCKYSEAHKFYQFCKNRKLEDLILVGYNLKYSIGFSKLRKLKNKIGDLKQVEIKCLTYLPNWRPGRDYTKTVSARKSLGGGVLLELSHELDYLISILGNVSLKDAELKNTKKLKIDRKIEDHVKLHFTNNNNVSINVELDFSNLRKNSRQCKLIGKKGYLVWDLKNQRIEKYLYKNKSKKKISLPGDISNSYKKQIIFFNKMIISKQKLKKTNQLKDAVYVMKIISQIKKNFKIKL